MTSQQFARWKRLARGLTLACDHKQRAEVAEHVDRLIGIIVWDGYKENPQRVECWDGNTGEVYVCATARPIWIAS